RRSTGARCARCSRRACCTPRTRTLRSIRTRCTAGPSRSLTALRVRTDPAAVLDAAVDLSGALHAQSQLEVGRFAALPHEIDRAGRFFAAWFDDDRAVFDSPVAVARPTVERLAVEERRPPLVLVEIDRIRLPEPTAAAAAPLALPGPLRLALPG